MHIGKHAHSIGEHTHTHAHTHTYTHLHICTHREFSGLSSSLNMLADSTERMITNTTTIIDTMLTQVQCIHIDGYMLCIGLSVRGM